VATLFVVLFFIMVFTLAWAISAWKRSIRRAEQIDSLHAAWSKLVSRERDFDLYPSLLQARKFDTKPQYLDDLTWQDLNLDLVFAHLDRTCSMPGECELYRMLRIPEATAPPLENRDRVISLLQTDVAGRVRLQLHLSQLGRTRYPQGLVELLWGELPPRSRLGLAYTLLAILTALCLGTAVVLGVSGHSSFRVAMLTFAALYASHLVIHYHTRRVFSDQVLAIRYLSKLVTTGRALAGTGITGLKDQLEMLGRDATQARRIPSATAALVPERGGAVEIVDIAQEYFAILLLAEARGFHVVLEEIRNCREALQRLFTTLGELDSFQAIASFREGLGTYAKPDFQDTGSLMTLDCVFHPLLESPVANSISVTGRGCLITGSNMSGKSTFLRALGVNAVLAQSVYTCPARSYKGSMFRIISSLVRNDDIVEGKSLYLAEAEGLLAMVSSVEGSMPTLCLIDELLHGTNSRERLAASEEILAYLACKNALVIAATHDLQLVDRLAHLYETYHFTDYVDEKGLHFDYRLRPGKATTTNAIRLLEYLGYPPEITRKAHDRAFHPDETP
jgi:hypothetical protein